MTYSVKKKFRDRPTLVIYSVGQTYPGDDEDYTQLLLDKGYIEEVSVESGLKHLGAGYYELPNGEKVRGKDKAEEALKALQEQSGDDADGALGQTEKDA